MKRAACVIMVLLVILCFANVGSAGIPGATDKVRSASLLVPFFEVGVDVTTHPHDTLLVVFGMAAAKFHYHVWDIDGNAVALYGNIDLASAEGWSASLRDLINSASGAVKTALTDASGNYYRGFVTIDVVTADTTLSPTEAGYPLGTANSLEGYIYYVRILEGSSNALTMIPIEEVGTGVDNYLHGFYGSSDGREEIDVEGRACAAELATGGTCSAHNTINRVRSRVFLSPALNASTRIIIFLWDTGETEGISTFCDTNPNCASTYTYRRYDEAGNMVQDTDIRLDHVVNVIDVTGTENGFVSIWEIPSGVGDWQVYAFSITNAKPSSGTSANWDAILESYIYP